VTRLLLWDVDGTLLHSGGAGRGVFDTAISAVLDRELGPAVMDRVAMSGKTDPQIAREILRLAEVADPDIDAHLPAVLSRVEEELAAAADRIRHEGSLCPGIAGLLPALAAVPGVVQTVLTGNLAANAAVKVGAFGLERWLDLEIGAYGSDDEDRERLVAVALEKVQSERGLAAAPTDVWIIGDTPRDLACARAGGVRCALVGTGRYGFEELSALDADAVLPDLADTAAVVELLTR
jgi:phosphoglycolate phosphatase-like HAD superfamily hydrolase